MKLLRDVLLFCSFVLSNQPTYTWFCKWASETPQSAEATALQEMQLLLRWIFGGQHILNDTLDGHQHRLIVRYRENVVDFLIEQRMTIKPK